MKRRTNFLDYITIGLLVTIIVLLTYIICKADSNHVGNREVKNYLDSFNKRNELLYAKVDSLQKVKTNLYKEYTKTKTKYDTVQIAIDTMPSLDATKLLLSISRQLTAKGIE